MILQLKQDVSELQHIIARLQSEKMALVHEDISLNTKCDTLQTILVNTKNSSSMSSVSSSSLESQLSPSDNDEQKPVLLCGFVREDYDDELNPQDYPLVQSWTKKRINVSCQYLQDEKGITVSAQHVKTIHNVMLSCFRQLDSQGLTPASISQASLDVMNWLFHTLRKHCPELQLCVDNWKTTKLMVENYSQWYNYHVKKKGNKLVKHEDMTSSCDDQELKDKGKQKEIPSNMEIRSPLDGLIINPIATSLSAYSTTTLASKPSSSNTSLPMTTIPSPDLPSSNNDFSKPMQVTANITVQNLCALDWQQNGNQTEPACAFAAYWNKLSNSDKDVYKQKAAAAHLNSASSSAQSVPGSD
ncbi:hypothetical protein BDR05DRAFT_952743 [Suillus weaverae]|nr:hypothetical protein BDR05DRAFT_952743 [Suillus weaverae]